MSKHTPGPWILYADVPSADPDWHIVTTENRLRVVANVHIEPGNETDAANARLIAAAPEMLAALEQFPSPTDFASADAFRLATDKWWDKIVLPAINAAKAGVS